MQLLEYIQYLDNSILDYIVLHLHSDFMDKLMPLITSLGNFGLIWILAALLMIISKRYRKYGFLMLVTLALCTLIGNSIIKPLVGRIRPCNVDTSIALLISRPEGFSFPSGHTTSSAGAATIILIADKKLGTVAWVLAIMIAFSRLYLYVHYPSDVFAGLILGIGLALLTMLLYKQLKLLRSKNDALPS